MKKNLSIVFYGDSKNVKENIQRYLKANTKIQNVDMLFYGFKDPKIENILLNRTVSRKVSFDKFTLDILNLLNKKKGYKIEAISFVDLTYKNFIKILIKINIKFSWIMLLLIICIH